MPTLTWILFIALLALTVPSTAQNCTNDLVSTNYDVLDAASDNCTRFPTDIPRALWLPPLSEFLRIDTSFPHFFNVTTNNGTVISAQLRARLFDNTTCAGTIEFDFVADFRNFSGRCNATDALKLELKPECYTNLNLPISCYQCFDFWNGTLTGVDGSWYEDSVITLKSRPEHPEAQTGVGANNKNINFGLSGWCNWKIEKTCRSPARFTSRYGRRGFKHDDDPHICDINVDLVPPRGPGVSGDPHFIGFRGQRFDFHGQVDSVFNLISDTSLQVNALFVNADLRPKKLHKTYIGELGVMVGEHKLRFACNRGFAEHIIEVDGQELLKSKPISLSDEHYALLIRDVNDKITIDFHPFLLRAWFSSSRHSSCHISLRASYTGNTAVSMPHGILGQTVSPLVPGSNGLGPKSLQGEGIIEGQWIDYMIQSGDLFGSGFKFNRYDETLENDANFLQALNEEMEDPTDTLSAASY